MKTAKVLICDNCGKQGARTRKITKTYGKGKDLFVIENVPIITCTQCGESYITAETLHEIERIKLHKKSFSIKRSVSVTEFAL